jgi:hypothetical protein
MILAWIVIVILMVVVLLVGLTTFRSQWGSLIMSFCAVVKTTLFPLSKSKQGLTY